MKVARRIYLVPTVGSDGTVNKFDDPAAVTLTALQEMCDAADPLDRLYPLPVMENVENLRAETVFFEWNSGQKVRIRQGARTFTAALPNDTADTTLLKQLQNWYGQSFGVYIIDKTGNFIYNTNADGEVLPLPVDGNSFDVNLVTETYSDPLYVMLQFDFLEDMNDGDTHYIPIENLDFNGLGSDVYGLWDLEFSESTGTATDVITTIKTLYGVPVTGLVDTDMTLYNVTQSASVTITTVVEDTIVPGKYTVSYTVGVTSTDVVRLTVSKSKYTTTYTDITTA